MAEQAYTEHRYGHYGGTTRVKPARSGGAEKYRSTESAMGDKMRYNVTRFEGESNSVHTDDGGETTDYKAAYSYVTNAAQRIADTNTGRNTGVAYIYDSTLSPGGKITDEQAVQLVDAYKADLESRGLRVGGMTYTIHQNTQNTHVHMMYATNRTIQHNENKTNKVQMAKEADKLRSPEQAREWQAQQERAAERKAQRQATRSTRSTEDDHDTRSRGRGR